MEGSSIYRTNFQQEMKRIRHFDLNGSTSNPQNIVEPQGSYYQAGGDVKSLVRSQCRGNKNTRTLLSDELGLAHDILPGHFSFYASISLKLLQSQIEKDDPKSNDPAGLCITPTLEISASFSKGMLA
jgi:hypothetical protein